MIYKTLKIKFLGFSVQSFLEKTLKTRSLSKNMVNGIERPLDLLNSAKGKEILVQLKNGKQMVGTLLAFDIHINVVLDNAKEIENGEQTKSLGLLFLRGDTIIFISPSAAGK